MERVVFYLLRFHLPTTGPAFKIIQSIYQVLEAGVCPVGKEKRQRQTRMT